MTEPLLGEWACLGVLYASPAHGFAIAAQLRPDTTLGRVWSLSRPLTYRALEQLTQRGWVEPVGSEPGDGGPTRTVLRASRRGRHQLRQWIRTPVPHLRDLRSELLLKLVIADTIDVDPMPLIDAQRSVVAEHQAMLERELAQHPNDTVVRWRLAVARAADVFLDELS